ncbi:YbgC/FadM family acyl-CoA thioesterase [Sphingomicrobium lutaoense]|uniref:Acyl-CoA thioester hydrolase n=1 Tax=Sphingomicrobium lutaoense TaxID=515949 RepID=A0A839Z080_9SPHN|nr:YbgC/FadM family acyl-CoA thioesterase [Sphingomicrobium lutaoense]MBB3763043.1 acyl-CoA thioester hydrolase [Sphingomicrobium lutaoense]
MTGETLDRPYRGDFLGNTHHFALTVYYEDTDLSGIVYHANYLRFFERARSDMLRSLGIDQRAAFEQGLGTYAVTEMQIRWKRPAKLDDELVILSKVTKIRAASCFIHQRVMRGREILADATVTAALLSPEGRPVRQPAEWIDKFSAKLAKGEE